MIITRLAGSFQDFGQVILGTLKPMWIHDCHFNLLWLRRMKTHKAHQLITYVLCVSELSFTGPVSSDMNKMKFLF